MIKGMRDHLYYYISLAIIVLLGGFLVVVSSPYVKWQLLFIVMTAFFYVVWGIIHHAVHHDLRAKIVIEYILIGGLVVAITFFVLA